MMQSQEVSKNISFKELATGIIKPTKNIIKLVSLGLGIILISWLLSQLELSATLKIIRSVPISLLLLGFLCYGLSFYFRAMRFKLLLPPDKSIHDLFLIVLVHYTALNIIPARLGELSYVYLLKKINQISTGYSLSSLLLARVFDQIAISTMFLISLCFVNVTTQWLKTLSLIVGGFLIALFTILMVILTYKERCFRWLKKILKRLGRDNSRVMRRILDELEGAITSFRGIESKKTLGKVLGLSLAIWASIFSVNYVLLVAFGIKLSYIEIVLARTFIILLTVLPFQLLNGIGIRQATWTFIALAMRVPKEVAIVSAFGAHILSTVYLFIFGVYGIWKISSIIRKA